MSETASRVRIPSLPPKWYNFYMVNQIFIFIVSLFFVIKGATLATKHASGLAQAFRLSKYTVGFLIVAVISILPETFISINAAINGIPSFGMGMLFGSNIADLTLIFAILIFYAGRGLKVESKIIKNHVMYPFLLLIPIVLGLDGHFTRVEGIVLILAGVVFYFQALREETPEAAAKLVKSGSHLQNGAMLILSMALLLAGSHFTVTSASAIANSLNVSPILIGMLIVGLGTTLPELFFSIQSIKKKDDSMAVGDILGTVLADATIVVGILATIQPFAFPKNIIYVTGTFMLLASILLFHFMKSGRTITTREAYILLIFWITFIFAEIITGV